MAISLGRFCSKLRNLRNIIAIEICELTVHSSKEDSAYPTHTAECMTRQRAYMNATHRFNRATRVDSTGKQPPLRDNVSHGQGTGLVSGLIIVECSRAILVDRQCRARARANPFVFAYTKQSSDGTTGYNEIMSVCRLINIPVITATEVRHRSPTAFWAMDNIDYNGHRSLHGAYGPFKEYRPERVCSATSDADPPNDWANHQL